MTPEQIIKRPIVLTEKATRLRDSSQFVFEVAREADKVAIRSAIEHLFNVKVTSVNTSIVRGKHRRMGRGHAKLNNWKKAVVTLKQGDNIDFFAENAES